MGTLETCITLSAPLGCRGRQRHESMVQSGHGRRVVGFFGFRDVFVGVCMKYLLGCWALGVLGLSFWKT